MHGSTRRWRAFALAGPLTGIALAGVAQADPAPPFAQVFARSVDAPRLAALDADVARAEGLAEQARARPNPSISVYGENFGGSSPYAGFGRTETTLQYNHTIELGGKRAARIAAGQAGVAAAGAQRHAARVAYAYDLARAYAAAEVAGRRIDLADDEVEEATADLNVARALVRAGREARLRQLQAETALDAMKADREEAVAAHAVALARLSALAGATTAWTGLSESLIDRLPSLPAIGPVDPAGNAALRAADADRDAATRRIAVEERRAVPDLTAQIGVRRLEVDNATALVAGVSLPLPLFDRNRGAIAAARAEARAAEARAAALRLETQADVAAARIMVDAADVRARAAARAMATADESYRLARLAYEAGKSPLIELLAARHDLGVARTSVLDAAAARLDARAGLARMAGVTLTGEPVQ